MGLLTGEEAEEILNEAYIRIVKLKAGTSFGDVALRGAGIKRTATINCCTPCIFLELSGVIYRKYMLSIAYQ